MELVITDESWREIGVLGFDSGDFAFGVDENNFEIKMKPGHYVPQDYTTKTYLVYSEDGAVGGMVRGVKLTASGDISLTGVTWSGFLAEHILMPPTGSAYFMATGEVTEIARTVVAALGLSDLVRVEGYTGVTATHIFVDNSGNRQTDASRFMDGWSALWQLVYEHGCNVTFIFDATTRQVVITISLQSDHTDDETLLVTPSKLSATLKQVPNHLVCLGKGELAERTVVDLYTDGSGNVSTTPTYFGAERRSQVYEDSGAEDAADLAGRGTEKLNELISNAASVNVDVPSSVNYELGDIVGGINTELSIATTAVIVKKIVRLTGTTSSIEYKTSL